MTQLDLPNVPTCGLCQDLGTLLWDPLNMGPPPPPPEYEEKHPVRVWHWSWKTETRACPACQGWGYACNGPWAEAHRIATTKPLHAAEHKHFGWKAAQKHVVAWYGDQARNHLAMLVHLGEYAQRAKAVIELVSKRIRALDEPEWPERDIEACDQCHFGFNLAPTRHPLTGRAAVACCECGYAWHYKQSDEALAKDKAWDEEHHKKAQAVMRYKGLSDETADDLLKRFLPYDVYSAFTSLPMVPQETIPELP